MLKSRPLDPPCEPETYWLSVLLAHGFAYASAWLAKQLPARDLPSSPSGYVDDGAPPGSRRLRYLSLAAWYLCLGVSLTLVAVKVWSRAAAIDWLVIVAPVSLLHVGIVIATVKQRASPNSVLVGPRAYARLHLCRHVRESLPVLTRLILYVGAAAWLDYVANEVPFGASLTVLIAVSLPYWASVARDLWSPSDRPSDRPTDRGGVGGGWRGWRGWSRSTRWRFALGLLGFGSSAFAVAALAWNLFPCLPVFVSLSPLVLPVMIAIALPLWYSAFRMLRRGSRREGSVTESSNSDPDQTCGGVGGGLSGESSVEASGDSPGEGSSFGSNV